MPDLLDLRPEDPSTVGNYRILRRLGAGGMGTVYLGRRAGHLAAVKVINRDLAHDPEYRRRFAREARAARTVDSPFTAQIIDADTAHPDQPWIATRYLNAPSLDAQVKRHGPLPLRDALDVTAGVAHALLAIHAAGIVHRDLKPGNVLLAQDGPHVIDFGIALPPEASTITGSGIVGSPSYMSPEQACSAEVTPASDVFALGGLLHFAVTGRPAHRGHHPAAVLYAVVHTDPDLSDLPHPATRALVRACLAKNPAARPTPADVVTTCRDVLATLPPPRRSGADPTPGRRAATAPASRRPAGRPAPPPTGGPPPPAVGGPSPRPAVASAPGARPRPATLTALSVLFTVTSTLDLLLAWALGTHEDGTGASVGALLIGLLTGALGRAVRHPGPALSTILRFTVPTLVVISFALPTELRNAVIVNAMLLVVTHYLLFRTVGGLPLRPWTWGRYFRRRESRRSARVLPPV